MNTTHTKHGFWHRFFFSLDHKDIGLQYLITSMFITFFAGIFALVFRMHLAFPDVPVWPFGIITNKEYNVLVTNHGLIMIMWFSMGILLAAAGNYLIPTMLGTDDMAFPKLNKLSYWFFLASVVVLIISFFLPQKGFGGGWTLYPPLSVGDFGYNTPYKSSLSRIFSSNAFVLLALALEIVALLMGGINFMVTLLNKRAKGMGLFRVPLVVWMIVIASILFMFSVGPLVAGTFMLLLDITVGTGFYDPYRGGDPLLWEHLFWFFGHPEVYVILLPGLGILAEVIAVNARKPLFGYKFILSLVTIAGILSLMVWAHHQFVAGIDPRAATIFSILTIIISLPFAGVILSYIATLKGSKFRLTLPMKWALGAILLFTILGGFTGLHLGASLFDIYVHDTSFVVAHFHYTLIPVVLFAGMAGFYHWFNKYSGRHLNKTLGEIHFWLTLIFFNLFAFPLFLLGLGGQPRRYAGYQHIDYLNGDYFTLLREIATVSAVILILSQFIFIFNFIWSVYKGKKVTDNNPWEATTLEWQTSSPPPHGNFETYPVVYHGPYEYSVPGSDKDYIPQNQKS